MMDALALLKELRNENYDIGMAEVYNFCGFALLHYLKVRTYSVMYAIPILPDMALSFGVPQPCSFVGSLRFPSKESSQTCSPNDLPSILLDSPTGRDSRTSFLEQ